METVGEQDRRRLALPEREERKALELVPSFKYEWGLAGQEGGGVHQAEETAWGLERAEHVGRK